MSDGNLKGLLGDKLPELDKMINSTPSCLKIVRADGRLLTMNPQGLNLIEAPDMDSVFGANVYDIVEESHRENFVNFNKMICSGQHGHLIFEIIGLKGTRRWMETYAAPYKLSNGEIAHIAITNDITEKVQQELVLLKQKTALEQSSRLATLGQFVSGIAHEINNPMAIIQGKAALLKKRIANGSFDKDYFEKCINDIEKTVVRVSKIITGLKTFSRDSANDRRENWPFQDIVNETLDLCREKFRLEEIDLRIHIGSDVFVFCNNVQVSQVLMNLLNNSYDAIRAQTEKWISIEAENSDDSILIKLTDSGNGIAPEVSEKMMNPFFTTKEVGVGTGLGLSISVGIMKNHGGNLTYNPESRHTQFLLRFPITQNQN